MAAKATNAIADRSDRIHDAVGTQRGSQIKKTAHERRLLAV